MFTRGARAASRTAGAILALALAASGAAAAPPAPVAVAVERGADGSFLVRGEFSVDAATAEVWGVLADYEKIPSFVRSMRSSRVVEASPGGATIVEQKATSGFLFFTKTVSVRLSVVRDGDFLRFDDLARSDFKFYSGDWSAEPRGAGSVVRYRLLARPDFAAPGAIVGRAMRGGARELLEQVRDEIAHRAAAGDGRPRPGIAKMGG